MKTPILSGLLSTLLPSMVAVALTTSAHAQNQAVHVYNWSDYIDPVVLEDFTKQTGIKVIYDVFDSNEIVETKLLAGASGYDVVVPSHNFLSRQVKAGIFQKLDKSKLPNIKYLDPAILAQTGQFDPDNSHSVTYMWGTAGLGLNEDKIKAIDPSAPIDSLALIFDPTIAEKFKDCGIYWMDTPEVMLPLALVYAGLEPNSINKDDLAKGYEVLRKARSTVRKFDASEYITSLANGDICIAVGYNGDVIQAQNRAEEANTGQKITYKIPKQGSQLWFDQMAIPADAKNLEQAYAFINFIIQPENIAKSSNFVGYPNAVPDSKAFLNKDIANDEAVYPSAETMKTLYITREYPAKIQRNINRDWSKLLTGK